MPRLGRTTLGLLPLILVLVVLPVSGSATFARQEATPDSAQKTSPIAMAGLLLTRLPLADEGAFDLVAVSPDTGERRRIPVPEPDQIVATPRPNQALVKTVSGAIYLVDAERATAEQLDIPPDVGADLLLSLRTPFVRTAGSDRWAVLSDPQQSMAYLIDLAGGEVTDLIPAVTDNNGINFVASVDLASDGGHLLLWSGRDLWLLPTDNPAAGRRLDEEAFGGAFSPDGAEVVYSRPTGDQTTEIVVAPIDGDGEAVVATVQGYVRADFTPDGDGLVLYESGRVSRLDLASGERREIVDLEGEATRTIPGLDGTRMLLGVVGPTDTPLRWYLIDTEQATAQTLDDLRGFEYPLDWLAPERRWLAFADNQPFDIGGRANLRTVDLQTGAVGEPMSLVLAGETGAFFEPPADISADGRYRLVPVDRESGGSMSLLLLDAADNTLRPVVPEATRAAGAFDPAAPRVALSTLTRLPDGTTDSTLSLLDLDSGDETRLGDGIGVVWLQS